MKLTSAAIPSCLSCRNKRAHDNSFDQLVNQVNAVEANTI